MREYSIAPILSSKATKKYLYKHELKSCSKDILKDGHLVYKFFPEIGLDDHIETKKININIPADKLLYWVKYYVSNCSPRLSNDNTDTDLFILRHIAKFGIVKNNKIIITERLNILDSISLVIERVLNRKKFIVLRKNSCVDNIIKYIFANNSSIGIDLNKLNNLYVGFTSDPDDLFNMSMSGITSCMRHDSIHSSSLVGSIFDRYCSMIFLTDGEKIISRSLVRLVENTNKKINGKIFIERVYIGTEYGGKEDNNIRGLIKPDLQVIIKEIYKNYLLSNLKENKADILTQRDYSHTIVSSPEVDQLKFRHTGNGRSLLSLSDAGLQYTYN